MPGVYLLYDEGGVGKIDRLPGSRENYKPYGACTLATGIDALLSTYANNKAIGTPNAFTVDGLDIKISDLRTHKVLSAIIPGLQMNTKFILSDGKLLPKFDGHASAVPASLYWKAPANMNLFFAVQTRHNEHADNHYWAINPFLWAMVKGEKNYWRLPLPNVYDESRVCLGDLFFDIKSKSLPELWKLCYQRFVHSTWNADLLANKLLHAQAMFQFSPLENSPSLECPLDWTKWCARCSHAVHEEALA